MRSSLCLIRCGGDQANGFSISIMIITFIQFQNKKCKQATIDNQRLPLSSNGSGALAGTPVTETGPSRQLNNRVGRRSGNTGTDRIRRYNYRCLDRFVVEEGEAEAGPTSGSAPTPRGRRRQRPTARSNRYRDGYTHTHGYTRTHDQTPNNRRGVIRKGPGSTPGGIRGIDQNRWRAQAA
jgi:hypothetical protein